MGRTCIYPSIPPYALKQLTSARSSTIANMDSSAGIKNVELIETMNGVNLPVGKYKALEVDVTLNVSTGLPNDYVLLENWMRESATNSYYPLDSLYFLINGFLQFPQLEYGGAVFEQSTVQLDQCNLTGRLYKVVYDSTNSQPVNPPVWLPVSPADLEISYSYYLEDTTTAPTGNTELPGIVNAIQVFPNPGDRYFEVIIQKAAGESVYLDLYDLNGRHVATVFNGSNKGERVHKKINTETLSPGVYILSGRMGGKNINEKIVVVHE